MRPAGSPKRIACCVCGGKWPAHFFEFRKRAFTMLNPMRHALAQTRRLPLNDRELDSLAQYFDHYGRLKNICYRHFRAMARVGQSTIRKLGDRFRLPPLEQPAPAPAAPAPRPAPLSAPGARPTELARPELASLLHCWLTQLFGEQPERGPPVVVDRGLARSRRALYLKFVEHLQGRASLAMNTFWRLCDARISLTFL